jgi:two-component system nitrogen regulation response regulator GlnG
VKLGAFDYIVKPFDLDHVQAVIERALATRDFEPVFANDAPIQELLVGSSPVMNEVFKQIGLAAESDSAILLQGESGTGKELAARAIHINSDRSHGTFVAVNIAALSPSLAESELFGHVRGAFTGAAETKIGLLGQADGGTLFLDEVAEIPENIQVKLLRALEHKEFQPVGSTENIKSNFRLISATHRDLATLVDQNRFRHDLFFRISAFSIFLPPLRERQSDILELAKYFLKELSKDGQVAQLSPEAVQELESRYWHGNVRELRNALEQAAIVSRNQIIFAEHLPTPITGNLDVQSQTGGAAVDKLIRMWAEAQFRQNKQPTELYEKLIAEIEKPLFDIVLKKNRGQYSAAARQLGIHRTTLKKKAENYGITFD